MLLGLTSGLVLWIQQFQIWSFSPEIDIFQGKFASFLTKLESDIVQDLLYIHQFRDLKPDLAEIEHKDSTLSLIM